MVPDETLEDVLNSAANAEAACRKLVDLANDNGGRDNITLVVSRFLSPQLDEQRAFVEVEVPLDELTAMPTETTKATVRFEPPNIPSGVARET
jgi:serine/threonine protein phosphatase PrpC